MPALSATKAKSTAKPTTGKTGAATPATSAKPVKPAPARPTAKKPGKRLTAPQVLAYLRTHPAFFETYKDALLPYALPSKGGNVLSLHAHKAKKTDKKAEALKTRYTQFVEAARQNASTTASIHAAVLGALGCTTATTFRRFLQSKKEGGFMALLALNACHLATSVTDDEMALLTTGPVTLAPLNPGLHRPLFGANTPHIKSVCLLALTPSTLLALGSTDATRFHAGQATSLATFLGQALAAHWANLNG